MRGPRHGGFPCGFPFDQPPKGTTHTKMANAMFQPFRLSSTHLDARQKHVNVKLSWEAAHSWRSCPNLKTRKHSRFQANKTTSSAQINQQVRMCKQKKHQHRSTNQFEHRKPPDLSSHLHIFASPLSEASGLRAWPTNMAFSALGRTRQLTKASDSAHVLRGARVVPGRTWQVL